MEWSFDAAHGRAAGTPFAIGARRLSVWAAAYSALSGATPVGQVRQRVPRSSDGPGRNRPPTLPVMMKTRAPATPFWSTASFGDGTDTTPMELSGLREHMVSCRGAHGRLFTLQCLAEAADRFIAARLVTTLVVAAFLIGVATLLT